MIAKQVVTTVSDFELKNHDNISHRLSMMMGERGILLGFTDDVWHVSCVRYVLWLQRQSFKLATEGINSAIIVPNQTYELNGFFMSIPRIIPFPLLADPTAHIYHEFEMSRPGFMLISRDGEIQGRWYVDDTSSLSLSEILQNL